MGYNFARNFWGLSETHHRLHWKKYREWEESKIHLCRQNLQSFCLLICEDEKQAFDLFFEFHDMALDECRADLVIKEDLDAENFDLTKAEKSNTLIEFILNPEGIRKRPAMYFANNKISGLFAMCNGFLWAEKDLGIPDSSDAMNLELFQIWLDERYPIAKGKTWDKLFYFEALGYDDGAFERFYENFEMFLEGKNSDAPPKWVETVIENILKNSENQEE